MNRTQFRSAHCTNTNMRYTLLRVGKGAWLSLPLSAYLPRRLTSCDQGRWKSERGDEGFHNERFTRENKKYGDVCMVVRAWFRFTYPSFNHPWLSLCWWPLVRFYSAYFFFFFAFLLDVSFLFFDSDVKERPGSDGAMWVGPGLLIVFMTRVTSLFGVCVSLCLGI